MYIISRDRDVVFTLSDKGIFKGTIYVSEKRDEHGHLMGYNVYGRRIKTHLLGTYEEDEAEQIVYEIYALMKAGEKFYSMPDGTIDIDDLGVTLDGI